MVGICGIVESEDWFYDIKRNQRYDTGEIFDACEFYTSGGWALAREGTNEAALRLLGAVKAVSSGCFGMRIHEPFKGSDERKWKLRKLEFIPFDRWEGKNIINKVTRGSQRLLLFYFIVFFVLRKCENVIGFFHHLSFCECFLKWLKRIFQLVC